MVIYIPVWLDQKLEIILDVLNENFKFTFQYGQIRNVDTYDALRYSISIYIPVWLDQKHSI